MRAEGRGTKGFATTPGFLTYSWLLLSLSHRLCASPPRAGREREPSPCSGRDSVPLLVPLKTTLPISLPILLPLNIPFLFLFSFFSVFFPLLFPSLCFLYLTFFLLSSLSFLLLQEIEILAKFFFFFEFLLLALGTFKILLPPRFSWESSQSKLYCPIPCSMIDHFGARITYCFCVSRLRLTKETKDKGVKEKEKEKGKKKKKKCKK